MHNIPHVSVVIPTRARPSMLQRAIRSVLNQTFQAFEIVVVLDGDDAITADVVGQFGDERIKLIRLHQSVGGSEARNIGARNAVGRYVALLDDDDEWLPSKLEKQVEIAETCAGENAVVVTQYIYRAEGRSDEIWPSTMPSRGEHLSEFLFGSRGGFQTSTYLCSRELFLRVPFVAGMKKHQDWDWFLQVAALPRFELLVVQEPLSIYWVPSRGSASVSKNNDWEFSHRWVRSRRDLMTRKAYTRFLIKICTRSAKAQGARPAECLQIFRDLIVRGYPSPMLLGEFVVSALVTEEFRLRVRTFVRGLQRGRRFVGPGSQYGRLTHGSASQIECKEKL